MKLIIDIPENAKQAFDNAESNDLKGGYYDHGGIIGKAIQNGIPLDDDSERAEVQAYFDGQAYGWEEGRKALIEDLKAEIETNLSWEMFDEYGNETRLRKDLMEILDNIGNKDPNDLTHIFDGLTEIPKDVFKDWYTEKMLEQTRAESEEKANGKNE